MADKNVTRARFLGKRFGIDRYTEDYHQFVNDVDGMIIALPHTLHAPVAGELLGMGMPVLVEKPLAPTVEEATKLVEIAKQVRVPLQVGQMFRFSKAARLVKRVIDEGWLGTLQGFSLESGGSTVGRWPRDSSGRRSRRGAGS